MRGVLGFVAVGIGLAMLIAGGLAVFTPWGVPDAERAGKHAYGLRDQGLVALMGAGLVMLGVMRIAIKRPSDE